jgi:hypothetical protein
MLALLDEQVPVEFADVLNAAARERHTVRTVAEMGWRVTKNGALLRRMREVGLVVMHPHRVRIQELIPLALAVLTALDEVRPGAVVHVRP